MKQILSVMFVCVMIFLPLSAQYFSEIPEFNQEGVGYDMSNARSQAAFLDWSKFQMNHSVSMTMGGSAIGSQSYLTYHNQFYMPLNPRLSFYGNLYWQLQTSASNPVLERLNSPAGDIYFDANLVYKISENSTISLGIARYPGLFGNSYFPGGQFYNYQAYDPLFNPYRRGFYP